MKIDGVIEYYEEHAFDVYTAALKSESLPTTGAVYVFSRGHSVAGGALYVGQSCNLRRRLATHEKWPQDVARGVAEIHVHEEKSEKRRLLLESLIRAAYDPPLND